ncbi:MAG: hypothetical protein ACFE68_03285 [Candidatus Hodarchaeota archaeon]
MSFKFINLDPDYIITWIQKDGIHEIQKERRVKILQGVERVIACADLNIPVDEAYPSYVVRAVKRLSSIEDISSLDEYLQWEIPDRRVLEASIDLRKLVDTVINPDRTVIAISHRERPETEIHIIPNGEIQVIGEYASLENQVRFLNELLFCDVVLRRWENINEPFDPQVLTVLDNDRVPPQGRKPSDDWQHLWMTKILVEDPKKTMGYAMNIARIHRGDLANLILGMIPTVLSPSFIDSMRALTDFILPIFKKDTMITMSLGGKKEDKVEMAANIAEIPEYRNRFKFLLTGVFLPAFLLIQKGEEQKAKEYLLKIYKNKEKEMKKCFESLKKLQETGNPILPSHVNIDVTEPGETKIQLQEKTVEELKIEEITKIVDAWLDEEDIPDISSAAIVGPPGIEQSPKGLKEMTGVFEREKIPAYIFGGDATRALRLARIPFEKQYSMGGAVLKITAYLLGMAPIPTGLYYTVIGTLKAKQACGF